MTLERQFAVAPMMDCTDRHCRYFHRLLSKETIVYSEMIVDKAIIFGNRDRFLSYSPEEHPVALQLGGNDPKVLSEATKIAIDFGYDEVNLNVGCPSDRVNSGNFGAALMRNTTLVSECVEAMVKVAGVTPISVKSRIGVDEQNPEEILPFFIKNIADSGCETFIIHARKALLKGLSPKDNRTIPPLNYNLVFEMQKMFPDLKIVLNGGLKNLDDCKDYINDDVTGVMIGREAYENPAILLNVDNKFYDQKPPTICMREVVEKMLDYCEKVINEGIKLEYVLKHLKGAFKGTENSKRFKRILFNGEFNNEQKLKSLQAALKNFS